MVAAFQAGHALFNGALFLLFAYQGLLGWRIRRKRVAGVLQDFSVVKRHRALGPVLAAAAPLGYLAGLMLVYLHKGEWVSFPLHLIGGTALLAVVAAVFLVSKRIRGAQSPWRTPHFALGILLLVVFVAQIYLGLNVLL
jgi:hypothetical protein